MKKYHFDKKKIAERGKSKCVYDIRCSAGIFEKNDSNAVSPARGGGAAKRNAISRRLEENTTGVK